MRVISEASYVIDRRPSVEQVAEWDRLVDGVEHSDVSQLSCWARLRTRVGFGPMYVFVYEATDLVAGAQVLVRRIPVLGEIGYVSYGPVISAGAQDNLRARSAVSAGLAEIATTSTRMLFVQPPLDCPEVSEDLMRLGFRHSDAGIAPSTSIRVDLRGSAEDLRQGLSRRLRTWTNRWTDRGVMVRTGTAEDIALFARLLGSSAAHQGFDPLPLDYLEAMHRELGEHAVLFVGEVDGVPVAADLCTVSGGSLRSRLVGLDRSAEASRLSVSGAVKWSAMRWGQERGLAWFDLCGLGGEAAGDLIDGAATGQEGWRSQDRSKSRFGGTAYRYPQAVELIRPAPLRWVYDRSRQLPAGRALVGSAVRRLRGMRAGGRNGC